MIPQAQRIRAHFLIALTLVVAAFGVTRLLRTYRQKQVVTDYAQTERRLRVYAAKVFRAEHEQIAELAMEEHGRMQRDAAALFMQARYLLEQQGGSARMLVRDVARTGALAELKANFSRIRAGEPARFPRGEPFLRGYYSAVDGTIQPYGLCLPKDYEPEGSYPVMVTLHSGEGAGVFKCREAPCYGGAISVKPEARGAGGFMDIAEDDVLAALREVQQLYSTDRERVYLIGAGAGATGCWHLAVHYPHLISGIVAVDGRTGPGAWLRYAPGGAESQAWHQQVRAFLEASLSPAAYAENLDHCHVVAARGASGRAADLRDTRAMIERLRKLGSAPEYLEFLLQSGEDLARWREQLALPGILGRGPARVPSRFRYKTAYLRHNGAWWLRLDRLGRPMQFSSVEAEAEDGRVLIDTDNVSALTVLLNEAPATVNTACVDGVEFPVAAHARASTFSLEKWEGQWRPATPRPLMKRRGLSGPFADVTRDAFLVVYGTAGDSDLHRELSRWEAERFAETWKARYGDSPRIKADADVEPRDTRSLNLLLFGGPQVNGITKRIAERLPVGFEERGFTLAGESFEGTDVGLLLCYPNPLSPTRMVALVAGATPEALYQAQDRIGIRLSWRPYSNYKWFDYALFDARTAGTDTLVAAGLFDNEWQFRPKGDGPARGGAEWRGDPAAREILLPQTFPLLGSASESEEDQVLLCDVRPLAIEQDYGAVAFDRSCEGTAIRLAGEEFQRGLGVRSPSAVRFMLGGQFQSFSATVGLTGGGPPSASSAVSGEVVFQVEGDGRRLATSPPLSRKGDGNTSAQLSVDVKGVRVLTLAVLPSGAREPGTSCAWGAPTVIR